MSIVLEANRVVARGRIAYPHLEIEQGRTTFLCGESGSGKTTLLKLWNATEPPTAGALFYEGRNLLDWDTLALRREVLLVSQTVVLFEGTIRDNFLRFYAYRELPPPAEERMKRYLALCCLEFDLSAVCDALSGGERQRVFLAICISLLPKVLLLDEPTSALDEETSRRLFEKLKAFCGERSMTLLAVSHDRALAERFADRLIVLEKGAAQ